MAYAKIPNEKHSKLSPQSVKCILLGYQGTSIYRLYDPDLQTVFVLRDVRFIELDPHRIVGNEGERRAGELFEIDVPGTDEDDDGCRWWRTRGRLWAWRQWPGWYPRMKLQEYRRGR